MASPGSLTAAAIKEGARVWQGLFVPVDNIHVDPTFNLRIPGPALEAHIEWLANEIYQKGFDSTQPLAVIRHPDISGHVIVRKGHCRYEAILRARAMGRVIIDIACAPEPQGTNEVKQTYQLGTSNNGLGLGYLEYAAAVMRQRACGETDEQILVGFGKTKDPGWLSRVLDLSEAPVEIRQMVVKGQVPQTEALKAHRKHGTGAPVVLREALSHANARNKTRLTARDVAAVTKPRETPVSLCSLAMAVVRADDDGDMVAVRDAIAALRTHLGPLAVAA